MFAMKGRVHSMIKNERVKSILDEIYEYLKDEGSYREMFNSDFSKGLLPDVSIEKVQEAEAYAAEVRGKIQALREEAGELEHYDEMMLRIAEFYADTNFFIGGCENPCSIEFIDLDFSITPNNSPLSYMTALQGIKTDTSPTECKRYIRMMMQYPKLATDCLRRTQSQIEHGIYMPKTELELTTHALRGIALPVEKNPLCLTPKKLWDGYATSEKERLCGIANVSLEKAVSKLQELIGILESENYRNNSPQTIGLSQYPKGEEYYRKLVKYHCSYDITPEELYEFAENHLKKLEEKIDQMIWLAGYKCSHEEFHEIIMKDPLLYEKTVSGIQRRYERYLEKAKGILPLYFEKIPKADCGVERMPLENEESMAMGYFAAPSKGHPKGRYLYNGLEPEKQNQISCASVVYHELLPGHHFQMSLTIESEELPPLVKNLYYITSYGEGWAEYAANFMLDIGMYEDFLDAYGHISKNVRQTVQVLIDIGVNSLGWSFDKAKEMFQKYTGWSDMATNAEINRFANDIQGQALSYIFCCEKMRDLRALAENELGYLFDIKEFHTIMLELGAVPMSILEAHVKWYIDEKKKELGKKLDKGK